MKNVMKLKMHWIPLVIVANKIDRQTNELGLKFCSEHKIPYFEIDLKQEMEKVEEIFFCLAKLIKEKGIIYNSEINYFKSL